MFEVLLYTFLLSLSPLGEARAGIPYAVLNDVHIFWAFITGLVANLLIYPMFMWLIKKFSLKFWPYRMYRKGVIHLSKRAKKGIGADSEKYGFWGLMIFVMIPLPGTGAYMGTIAATVLKIAPRKAFLAISLGVFVSCVIMAAGTYLGSMGLKLL